MHCAVTPRLPPVQNQPAGHTVVDELEPCGQKMPAPQKEQGSPPGGAEKEPTGQMVQAAEPAAEPKPAVQFVHEAALVRLGSALAVPAGHAAGAWPETQNMPAGHGVVLFVAPPGQKTPDVQAMGATPPGQ